jgi:hypothetical protein
MQFSFNFLAENMDQCTSPQPVDPARIFSGDKEGMDRSTVPHEGMIKVIPCPAFDIAKLQRRSSSIELQTCNGDAFNLLRVQEGNPENEYDLIPGKYEGTSESEWRCCDNSTTQPDVL